jgi:drug/metabolite transporter (DMT)-like permease
MQDFQAASVGSLGEMEYEDYAVLLGLAGLWGASFLFIKLAVGEMSPFFLVFGRCLAAAAGLALFMPLARIPMSALRRQWKAGLVIAVFNAALPYCLIAFGEKSIDSSLAGILNGTAPLWTAMLAPLWAEADGLHPQQYGGLALGFIGVVVLARPSGGILSSSSIGVIAVVAATLSYAFAAHFSRRYFQETPPLVPAFLQCALGALVLLPLALATAPTRPLSVLAIGAVLWLGLGATGLAMVAAFRLIKRVGASRTIVVTYLIPPFALVYGVALLHESLSLTTVVALLLILSGVFLNTSSARPLATPVAPDEAVVELEA